MTILGHIIGIIILIVVVVFCVKMVRVVLNFDFDAPIFKIDISISEKDKNDEKE